MSRLANASAGVQEIYLACLPWLREQASLMLTPQDGEDPKTGRELIKLLGDVIEESADLIEEPGHQTVGRAQCTDRSSAGKKCGTAQKAPVLVVSKNLSGY